MTVLLNAGNIGPSYARMAVGDTGTDKVSLNVTTEGSRTADIVVNKAELLAALGVEPEPIVPEGIGAVIESVIYPGVLYVRLGPQLWRSVARQFPYGDAEMLALLKDGRGKVISEGIDPATEQ